MKKIFFGILLSLVLSFGTVRPLFVSGFFPMHDDTQIARVIVMGNALRNGQFPVRWVNDLGYGYGYPIFNFYGPLPYYVGGFLYSIGADALLATKIMIGLGTLLAVITMYVLAERYLGFTAGVASAVLFAYAPYHAVQIYVRGSVGELWAYSLLPLLILEVLENSAHGQKKAVLIGGLAFAGIILSHTVTGYITALILGAVLIGTIGVSLIRKRFFASTIRLMKIIVTGAAASAFFWLPAFFEKVYTRVEGFMWDRVNYVDHFVCLPQLWNSIWGYGGSAPGCIDGMSFMIGKLHILLFLLSMVLLWYFRTTRKDLLVYAKVSILLTITAIFMMLSVSLPVWLIIPNALYIQYPWRFLSIVAAGSAMGAGIMFALVKNPLVRKFTVFVCISVIIAYNSKWFRPQYNYNITSSEYNSAKDLRFRVSLISDEYMPPTFKRPTSFNEVPTSILRTSSDVSVSYEKDTETYVKAQIKADRVSRITVNRVYFPGWVYFINGRKTAPVIEDSLPVLMLPQGDSVFEMRFSDTPVRIFGNVLSIITCTVLLIYYGRKAIS